MRRADVCGSVRLISHAVQTHFERAGSTRRCRVSQGSPLRDVRHAPSCPECVGGAPTRRSSTGKPWLTWHQAASTQGAFGIHSARSVPRIPERTVENGSILCHGGPSDTINGSQRGHHQFLAQALRYLRPMAWTRPQRLGRVRATCCAPSVRSAASTGKVNALWHARCVSPCLLTIDCAVAAQWMQEFHQPP
jgi:hypothetical protein